MTSHSFVQSCRRATLRPISALYSRAIAWRNWFYDKGWGVRRAPVPVISVGNITTGGTGKTPMVIALGQMLLERGIRIAVVSRGYRRKGRGITIVSDGSGSRAPVAQSGDELALIADRLPGAVVIASRRRYDGALRAWKEYNARVVLLDDGFQHRALARDLDVVMVDAATLDAENLVIPAGTLREPLESLRRAHVLCTVDPECCQMLQRAGFIPALHATLSLEQWTDLQGEPIETPRGDAVEVCAIARPERFRTMLERHCQLQIRQALCWSDHHWYSAADVEHIIDRAEQCRLVVTTEKDAVKLRQYCEQFRRRGCVVAVAQMALTFSPADSALLERMVMDVLQAASR